jgi:hypothetical protein
MKNIDDVCTRDEFRPNVYIPVLKEEVVRLREQEKEADRLRRVIRMALDSFEEKCPLIAEQTLRLSLEK